jgi:hypothetical protein
MTRLPLTIAVMLCSCFMASAALRAQEPEGKPDIKADDGPTTEQAAAPQQLELDEGKLLVPVPGNWAKVEPRSRIIEHEFQVSATKPDETAAEAPEPATDQGRMTITLSGGTIEANMQRWLGQFRLGRDADGEDAMQRESFEVGPLKVHQLDIAGTFFDMPKGPFGEKIERPDYRMLGAMIETPASGTWYIKFYGPAELVEQQSEAFREMLSGLKGTGKVEAEPESEAPAEKPVDVPQSE